MPEKEAFMPLSPRKVRGHCPSGKKNNRNILLKSVISTIMSIKKFTFQGISNQSECFVVERSWINEANSETNAWRGGSRFKNPFLPPPTDGPWLSREPGCKLNIRRLEVWWAAVDHQLTAFTETLSVRPLKCRKQKSRCAACKRVFSHFYKW